MSFGPPRGSINEQPNEINSKTNNKSHQYISEQFRLYPRIIKQIEKEKDNKEVKITRPSQRHKTQQKQQN